MNVLALDQATVTGWAVGLHHGKVINSGTWDLKPRTGESMGMRTVRFRSKVQEILDAYPIDVIVYERPAGRNIRAIQVSSELVGQIHTLCLDRGLEYASYSPGEVKKHATGKGNSNNTT